MRIIKWKKLTEWAGIILVLYYVCVGFYDSSRFTFLLLGVSRIFSVAAPMALVGGIRYLICAAGAWKENRRMIIIRTAFLVAFAIPCLILTVRFDYVNFAYLFCAILCLYDADANRVLKAFGLVLGLLLAGTVLCSITGAVQNLVSASIGESHYGNVRSAYGIASATDFAAYFVFWIAFFWASRERKRDVWNVVFTIGLTLAAGWGIYFFTSTWTSILLCLILAFFMLYEVLEREVLGKHKGTRWIPRMVSFLSVAAFPALNILFVLFTWLYGHGSSLAVRLDNLIDSRLSLAWSSYQKYGIHLFGALTPQNGWGGNIIHNWQGTYDFLDGGYGLLLIRYGVMVTLLITAMWVWMTVRALKRGYRRLAFVMAVIAIHTFEEHHFPELNYNILLAMPLCSFAVIPADTRQSTKNKLSRLIREDIYPWVPWGIGGILIIACAYLFPFFIPRVRTLFAIKNWTGGENRSLFAMLLFLVCAVLLIVLWKSAAQFLFILLSKSYDDKEAESYASEKREKYQRKNNLVQIKNQKLAIAGIVIPVMMLISLGIWTEREIQIGGSRFNERLEADADAVELILNAAGQPVYVAQLGEIYRRRFDGFSELLNSPETLGGDISGTMIVDQTEESYVLLNTGALYAEISAYSSIYTYDEAVISALQDAGFSLHGYYTTEKEIELGENGLRLENDYVNQTDLSLYGSTYLNTYELSVEPGILQNLEGPVCTLEITTYHGDNLIIKKDVSTSDFNTDGKAWETLSYNIGNCAGVEFNVYPYVPVKLSRIAYKKNPAGDTWRTYDRYNRLVKERYFSVDGMPTAQAEGQYGVSYEYQPGSDVWVVRQFLDENGHIMKGLTGYAQVQRTMNEKQQIIEIRYLDESGNLIMRNGNYAMERWEYDAKGRVTIFTYYNIEEEPVIISNGHAELRRIYNDKNQRIREEYFGVDGEPVPHVFGQAAEEYEYDEAGNISIIRYYGIDGAPVLLTHGYAELHRSFNDLGQVVEERYYGLDNRPVLLPFGYAIIERGYDEAGNRNFEKYYGINREPVRNISGYGELHRTFEGSRVIRDDYFDTDGTPIAIGANYYAVSYNYDDAGNIDSYTYLGINGEPCMRSDGFSELRRVFNEKKQIVRQEHYDSTGNPVNLPEGYFAVDYVLGYNGDVKEEQYYDKEGMLVNTIIK